MATYSANTTIKVNGAVGTNITITSNTTSGVTYTAPSNGYAILQVAVSAGGTFQYQTILSNRPCHPPLSANAGYSNIYVGPSQTVQVITTGYSVSATISYTGVEFVNTP